MTIDLVLTEEFAKSLDILHSGGNLFLTGRAGTGKSTLIRHFMATSQGNIMVAAPTGIAALNVEGYTIHRLFSFATTTTLDDVRTGDYYPGRFASTLKALETLIIDEASMVRADLFDKLVAALERFGPRPGAPFGGVQLVLVGDLYQLPPVVPDAEAHFVKTRYATPYFFSADRFSRDDFPTVALTTVFRQQGDQRLTGILNAIREGVLLEQSRAELNERTDPGFERSDDEFWLTVAPTNRIVTARNRQRLERLPGEEHAWTAREGGDLALFDPPVERTVRYKVGAQVMLLNNDPADRWVNGSIGRITAVGHDDGNPVVSVALRDGGTAEVRPHTWEATRPVVDGGTLRQEVVGTYTQLPLKLAWAITIHKSQGQTLDRLVVDLTGGAFDFGQVYVALSRCTSMDGLVLTRDVLPKDLKTDRRVVRFLHAATAEQRTWRFCALNVLTIGEEGRMSRPRPVEIGVAFDDGTSVSTLINPQRDLGSGKADYGITVDDVLLAPSLAEAWAVIAPLVEGCTPVGIGTDEALGLIDHELKRLGHVEPLPLGVDLPEGSLTAAERVALHSGTAAARARASLAAHTRLGLHDAGATAFEFRETEGHGMSYLLTREPDAAVPRAEDLPNLDALLEISSAISMVVLDGGTAVGASASVDGASPGSAGPSVEVHPALRQVVIERLATATEKSAGLPSGMIDRLRRLETLWGTPFVDSLPGVRGGAGGGVDEHLAPGARVCFTGEVHGPDGQVLSRAEMTDLATRCGLVPVNTVTKTKCDVLVVAERGTMSGKARKAKEYGKPVLAAEDFFAWAASAAVA